MKGPQGVILLMIAALVLWFTWSANSPFRGKNAKQPDIQTDKGGKSIVPPGTSPNVDGAFPAIPPEILGPYNECKANGGDWDFTQNKCFYKG